MSPFAKSAATTGQKSCRNRAGLMNLSLPPLSCWCAFTVQTLLPLQMRLHVWRADRQGDGISAGVHVREPTAGPIRDTVVQEE